MKITFICGSLEPGRDGVGDYTRRLAGELIRQGHQAQIIAWNDKYVSETTTETQHSDDAAIEVLRIASSRNKKSGIKTAQIFIDQFNPEWLSLQFVPFAFQKKGLPFFLAEELVQIGKGRKWHVMFHELWVGMEQNTTSKLKLWGVVQKYLISNLLLRLRSDTCSTQSELYQWQLERQNVHSTILPLFGNINKVPSTNNKAKQNIIRFIVFGNIHHSAPVESFAKWLFQYQQICKKETEVVFIGRCGKELENWVKVLEENKIKTKVLGVQPEEAVSKELAISHYGISSTPFLLIQKSGTVAAMLEHNLPVICVSRDWCVKGFHLTKIPNIYTLKKVESENLTLPWGFEETQVNVEFIAKEFIKQLK